MTIGNGDKEFLALLDQEPLRIENKRRCDRLSDLNDEELNIILSLQHTGSLDEACSRLRPLYQKYKGGSGKRIMPEMVIRGIYFIIFREMTLIMEKDKYKNAKDRIWLSEDGKLRKRILPNCTNRVYKQLGEKSSKVQERLGIQPSRDFTMLQYEPVNFHGLQAKDALFREMFLNVSFWADNPMFIDLTGEDSIFGDIYYCDREVVCCRDSVTANFYYALQLQYKDFSRLVKTTVMSFSADMEEIVAGYQAVLKRRNMQSLEALKIHSNEEYEEMRKFDSDNSHPAIQTYPLRYKDIDLDLAVKYLVVLLYHYCNKTTEQLQSEIMEMLQRQILWLRMRLEKTIISWSSVRDILSKIADGNMRFMYLQKTGIKYRPDFDIVKTEKYAYYENFEDTMARNKVEWENDLDIEGCNDPKTEIKRKEKNKERRVKKGFVFYDFRVRKEKNEARFFSDFVKRNECQWAFVCDQDDSIWAEELKGEKVKIVEINKTHPCAPFLKIAGYRDTMIITNVRVRDVQYHGIKRLLCAFDVDENHMRELITVRDSQTAKYEAVEETE